MSEKKYLYYLRSVSIFMVVLLHISVSYSLEGFGNTSMDYWWIQNIQSSITRWCVPMFFMMSGVLLLSDPRELGIKLFLKKRLSRILMPFVFFGIIYIIVDSFLYKYPIDLLMFLQVGPKWHMWFVYAIIPIYFLTPIIKKSVSVLNTKELNYFIFMWFFLSTGIDFLNTVFKANINNYVGIPLLTMFPAYFILGYAIDKMKYSKKNNILGIMCIIIGLGITIIGTYLYTKSNQGILNTYFYSYTTLNVVLMAVGIMICFKNLSYKKVPERIERAFKDISNHSYTIYLVHVLVIDIFRLSEFKLMEESISPIIRVPSMTIIVFLISYLIAKVLYKIPIIGAVI